MQLRDMCMNFQAASVLNAENAGNSFELLHRNASITGLAQSLAEPFADVSSLVKVLSLSFGFECRFYI